jgi:hypothetical protein
LIAPEKLMRTPLLQVFYSVRSERMLMVQMRHDLLFRWFVGLAIDHAEWDHSMFSKDRDRLAKLRLYTNMFPLQIATLLEFFTPLVENSSSGNPTGKLLPWSAYPVSGAARPPERGLRMNTRTTSKVVQAFARIPTGSVSGVSQHASHS